VVGDAVLFYQGDHVRRGEGGEGGLGEVGVFGEEVLRAGVEVGEVGAAAAGDEDLLADAVGVVEEEDAFAAASGFCGAEEACGSGAEDDDVEAGVFFGQLLIPPSPLFVQILLSMEVKR